MPRISAFTVLIYSHQQISEGDLLKWQKGLLTNQQVHNTCTEPRLQTAFGLFHHQTATDHCHGSEHFLLSDGLQDDSTDQERNN
jgi:hypothetical protein